MTVTARYLLIIITFSVANLLRDFRLNGLNG
jgi:hypothetical protein